MKTPVDTVKGKIVSVDEYGNVTIKAHYEDWYTFTKRDYQECLVQMMDSRPLSDKQRRACYAMIKEIGEYTGMGVEMTKEYMKLKFIADDLEETADKIFSLSNASMSMVAAFQRFLVRFILDFDIPCSFQLLKFVDDIDDYVYACLINKKCCICGKKADLHHVDRVGMGRNREEICHEGLKALPLCREHHTELHTVGDISFLGKYHINDGIPLDKTLCKIYGLNKRKGKQNV